MFNQTAMSQTNFGSYNQSGITWVYVNKNDARFMDVIAKIFISKAFSIPTKYDDNRIAKDLRQFRRE